MAVVPLAMFVIDTSGAKPPGDVGDPDDPAVPADADVEGAESEAGADAAGASDANEGEAVVESGTAV